jgi:hypothetical protein
VGRFIGGFSFLVDEVAQALIAGLVFPEVGLVASVDVVIADLDE